MHADAADPPRAAVCGRLAASPGEGRGGAREDPAPSQAAGAVHAAAHGVPDPGGELPLVDDVGHLAQRHERGVGAGEVEVVVDVAHARPVGQRRPRLPAPLGARYLHRAERPEVALHLLVHHAREVPLRRQPAPCHLAPSPLLTSIVAVRSVFSECGVRYFPIIAFGIFRQSSSAEHQPSVPVVDRHSERMTLRTPNGDQPAKTSSAKPESETPPNLEWNRPVRRAGGRRQGRGRAVQTWARAVPSAEQGSGMRSRLAPNGRRLRLRGDGACGYVRLRPVATAAKISREMPWSEPFKNRHAVGVNNQSTAPRGWSAGVGDRVPMGK